MDDAGEARLRVLRQWWALPDETRKEVRSLSRAGRHHPDHDVAWTAWRWADAVLPPGSPEPGRWRNMVSAVGFWLEILVKMAAEDANDPPAPHWLDRRRARRLLRVGPPVR
jgi:hypothetical protein